MTRLLLLGCGAFGRIHLAALARLGFDLGQDVAVLEPDAAMRAAAPPGTRFVQGLDAGLRDCDAAIIATPPATHAVLAEAVLRAGRDLFLEKPATETAAQSAALHDLATGRIVQLGLYFRFHPKAQAIHRLARAGGFGRIHHLSARMSGLKRARGDSGALLNDAVHFADLLPWIAGEAPSHVFATLSDPLGRGREDLAVIQLRFPSGATALIEAGCVLPGEHADAVVPGAETRKLLAVAGNAALAEVDFMAETLRLRRGAHHPARRNDPGGAWLPDHAPAEDLGAGALDPVGVVAAQLSAFLQAVQTRVNHGPDLHEGGVLPLRILDAARRSAHGMRVEELT